MFSMAQLGCFGEGILTGNSANAGFDLFDDDRDDERRLNVSVADASDFIVDIREWDVPYHVRVMIDLGMILAHSWYCNVNKFRYTDRKMVFGRGETRRYNYEMFRRATGACRSSGNGIRYRDDEITFEVPRRHNRSDHDDIIYD